MARESARIRAEHKAIEMGVINLTCTETEVSYITTNGEFHITQHFNDKGEFVSLDREKIA